MNSILKGIGLTLNSIGFMGQNGLRYVYFYMIALALLFFSCAGYGLYTIIDYVTGLTQNIVETYIQILWLQTLLIWLSGITAFVAGAMLFNVLSCTILLILYSPLLSNLGYKTYRILTNNRTEASISFFKSLFRGICVSLRNACMQIGLWILLFILGFLPGLGMVFHTLLILVNAYYFAASMADYIQEPMGLNVKQSIAMCKQKKYILCGVGLPITLILLLPIVGVYIALALLPSTLAAAGKAILEKQ